MWPVETTPFTIRIADAILADLREWLDRIRWPDEFPARAGNTALT